MLIYLTSYQTVSWAYTSTYVKKQVLIILYHIPNESANKKQHSCFPASDEGGSPDDIGSHSCDKNIFEQKKLTFYAKCLKKQDSRQETFLKQKLGSEIEMKVVMAQKFCMWN